MNKLGRSIIIISILLATTVQQSEASWDFMFSNKSYASNLTVQSIVVTEDEISELMKDTSESLANFTQKTNGEFYNRLGYLFIRINNNGNQSAWGTLLIEINKHEYLVNVPGVGANQSQWHYIITFIDGVFWPKNDKPEIKLRWKNLYAK